MRTVKSPSIVIFTFLWIGFICAISFLESWLKFQAPGITIPLGLGIGRLVFDALNKIEWFFMIGITILLIINKQKPKELKIIALGIIVLVLVLQTVWLLPAMDIRAVKLLNNEVLPPSNYHYYYVTAEVLKVSNLGVFGMSLFKRN